MLRFSCPTVERPSALTDLHGAYLVGSEGVPVRGEIRLSDGQIICEPRTQDAVALSLLWAAPGFGVVQLQTTRLPHRAQPYNLMLELARHQLLRINLKREEWGLFDYPGMEAISAEIGAARERFVAALEVGTLEPAATRLAAEALDRALWAAERLSQFHAGVFLGRRQQTNGFHRSFLGVVAPLEGPGPALTQAVTELSDFIRIPFTWREVHPTESGARYDTQDQWIRTAGQLKLALHGGPLLNFGVQSVPDWMYIYDNDFEAIFDHAREHVQRTVQRYAKQIPVWIAASGLNADSVFSLTFDQILELTRMAVQVTKQLAPRSQVLIDLTQPWGEYFARNQQTIPPFSYADLAVQHGLPFDAFGLQLICGIGSEGYHFRDLFQISTLIDRLANLGRPIHITAVAAPSAAPVGVKNPLNQGGRWHEAWSETAQADWLASVCEIALSKPYVESVCLQNLCDGAGSPIISGGILREDHGVKEAHARLTQLRARLQGGAAE